MNTSRFFLLLVTSLVVSSVVSAQSNRSGRNERMRAKMDTELFEKTSTLPCTYYDEEGYYTASGYMRIKAGGDGERDFAMVATKLLNSLRQQVKQKIGGQYKAVVRDYFDQTDIDDKSSAASHIESAGEQIIDAFLNDTEEDCRQVSPIDEAGYQTLYMGILVKKSELVRNLVDEMQNNDAVPSDAKVQLRANEKAFRDATCKQFGVTQETIQ